MPQFERSIIYPLDTPQFRDGLLDFIEDDGFRIKAEFHVTVADPAYRQALSPEQQERFEELLRAEPLSITYEDTLYRIEKPKQISDQSYERRSIVTLVKPDQILERVGKIAAQLEIGMPAVFPHVTVATAPDNIYAHRGISIYSAVEWQSLNPEIYLESWMK